MPLVRLSFCPSIYSMGVILPRPLFRTSIAIVHKQHRQPTQVGQSRGGSLPFCFPYDPGQIRSATSSPHTDPQSAILQPADGSSRLPVMFHQSMAAPHISKRPRRPPTATHTRTLHSRIPTSHQRQPTPRFKKAESIHRHRYLITALRRTRKPPPRHAYKLPSLVEGGICCVPSAGLQLPVSGSGECSPSRAL